MPKCQFLLCVAVAFCFLTSPAVAAAQPQDPAAAQPQETTTARQVVNFNHRDGREAAHTLYLKNGEIFTIAIHDTCETQFSYEVRSILREQPPPVQATHFPKASVLATKTVDIVHNDTYGGYLVNVIESTDPPPITCVDDDDALVTTLASATFIVNTPRRDWAVAFSGGFTISGLTNHIYFTNKEGALEMDTENRDDAKPGIATFVHMYNERWKWPVAPMFGLGIRDNNQTEYYFGGGVRMGDKATVNGGIVFGPMSRQLPTGMQSVSNAESVKNLPTKVSLSWFFGISYSFIAPMFGLGIRDNNQTEYYFGGGVRMGDKATVNGGIVFGPMSRQLPTGMQSVSNAESVKNLPTKVSLSWFFGISYSFIGVGVGQVQRPFAGASSGS